MELVSFLLEFENRPGEFQMAKDVSAPKVGEEAPDFMLKSHLDTDVKLSDFRGKKNVVMAFYPLAFTPV
jgi:peroxiredoxin